MEPIGPRSGTIPSMTGSARAAGARVRAESTTRVRYCNHFITVDMAVSLHDLGSLPRGFIKPPGRDVLARFSMGVVCGIIVVCSGPPLGRTGDGGVTLAGDPPSPFRSSSP